LHYARRILSLEIVPQPFLLFTSHPQRVRMAVSAHASAAGLARAATAPPTQVYVPRSTSRVVPAKSSGRHEPGEMHRSFAMSPPSFRTILSNRALDIQNSFQQMTLPATGMFPRKCIRSSCI
jgi:hypothetical protein